LVQAAKARAALAGRFAVSIDDIRHLAAPVLVHRVVRNFHAEADGVRADDLVASVVESVPTQTRP
jgi:MoxR-like ATPase